MRIRSWHIWVVDKPYARLQTKEVHAHTSSTTIRSNKMMTRNLGSCDASIRPRIVWIKFRQEESGEERLVEVFQKGGTDFISLDYQWGRKDPMPPKQRTIIGSSMKTSSQASASSTAIQAANRSSCTEDKGYYFYVDPSDYSKGTIFFPVTGFLQSSDGSFSSTQECYWTACPISYGKATGLQLSTSSVHTTYSIERARGASVRPVEE